MPSLEEIYFLTDSQFNSTSWPDISTSVATNETNSTDIDGNKFILPLWRQMIWTVLFVGMITVATGGNLIVIWIVLAHKRMRTVTNYFLVNLSIADAMVSTLNVTFNYSYMLNSHWTFGNLYCKISQFIAVLTICASVFTLMAISIDRPLLFQYEIRMTVKNSKYTPHQNGEDIIRKYTVIAYKYRQKYGSSWMERRLYRHPIGNLGYMAIMNPLRPRMGRRSTLCIAVAIWIVGAILSFPMLIYYKTYTQKFDSGEVRVICYGDWPNRDENGFSSDEYLYNVIFMILTYFLPIGSMTFTYARVGFELWGSQSIGESTQRQLDNIRSKRRVVKMMIVVVVIFAVCWLPFHVYFIVTPYLPEVTNEPYIQELFLAIYWLAMSNSMYNPMIYWWMNSRFRRGFAQFFAWCPGVNVAPEPALSRSEAVTSRYSCTGSPDGHTRISRNGNVRISLHLQPQRGMAMGNNNRFPAHHRGHGHRWGTTQPQRNMS